MKRLERLVSGTLSVPSNVTAFGNLRFNMKTGASEIWRCNDCEGDEREHPLVNPERQSICIHLECLA